MTCLGDIILYVDPNANYLTKTGSVPNDGLVRSGCLKRIVWLVQISFKTPGPWSKLGIIPNCVKSSRDSWHRVVLTILVCHPDWPKMTEDIEFRTV